MQLGRGNYGLVVGLCSFFKCGNSSTLGCDEVLLEESLCACTFSKVRSAGVVRCDRCFGSGRSR